MIITKPTFRTATGCALGLALAGATLGQQLTSGESGLDEEQTVVQEIQLAPSYTHIFEADFDRSGLGSITVDRIGARAAYSLMINDNKLTIGGLYELSTFDLSRGGTEDFHRVGADLLYLGMVNEKWGYFGYGAGQFSAATDASLDDGLMGLFGAGARYVHSPTLSIGFGAAIGTSLEDDDYLLPLLVVNWQISERWALRTLNGATVSYDITGRKQHLLDFGANYQRREYRLPERSGFSVDPRDSSVVERTFNFEFGYTYRFDEMFAVRAFAGVVAGRNYEVFADEHSLGDQDVDPAGYIGLRALFKF